MGRAKWAAASVGAGHRGAVRVHLGIEADFKPARKAHPTFVVADVRRLVAALGRVGYDVGDDEPLDGFDRIYVDDPFGNRIESMEYLKPPGPSRSKPRKAGRLSGRRSLTSAFFEPLPAEELDAWTDETGAGPTSEDPAAEGRMMTFSLHPQLQADTLAVGDLGLSRVLLMDDARYAWLILVPRRPDLVEITDLTPAARGLLMEEIALCSDVLKRIAAPDKLNVGAIGNRVSQLHIHIVARLVSDAAWPDPVWGHGAAARYAPEAGSARAAEIWSALALV